MVLLIRTEVILSELLPAGGITLARLGKHPSSKQPFKPPHDPGPHGLPPFNINDEEGVSVWIHFPATFITGGVVDLNIAAAHLDGVNLCGHG